MDFAEVVQRRRMVRSFASEPVAPEVVTRILPSAYLPIGIVLLGHEASDARQYGDVSATRRPRRPLTDVVHYGRWSS